MGRELIKRGWIKTYSRETGWGFIVCNEVERDIFVHWRGFRNPPKHSINGQTDAERFEVEFNLDETDPKKPKATDVIFMEGRRHNRVADREDDRKTLRLVAAASTPSEREASRTWERRREGALGADLPPLRRGQRPKPPLEPFQDFGSPTRSAPSRPLAPPRSTKVRDLPPPPEERPPLPRKVKGIPRPPPSQREADFFRSGSNGLSRPPGSRSRSRSLRRPLSAAHRIISTRGDLRQRSAPVARSHFDGERGERSDRESLRRLSESRARRSHRDRSPLTYPSRDRPTAAANVANAANAANGDSVSRPSRRSYDGDGPRPESRSERSPAESERSERWPEAGGEMKVLLPNAFAEDLDRSGVLTEIASQTKATVDLHDAVGGLHEICEGHRLLTLRGQKGSELQAAVQSLLAKAEKMNRRGSGGELKVLLPRFLASVVIGKRGANVRELQRGTGTRVQVEGGAMGQDRVTTVSGSSTSICNALGRIHRFGTEEEDEEPETNGDQENGRGHRAPQRESPPPEPWVLKEHPEAPGEYYYLNTETGETTWDRPKDRHGSRPRAPRPSPPPPPWTLQEHPDAAGEFYYLNEETGETTWELPDNAF